VCARTSRVFRAELPTAGNARHNFPVLTQLSAGKRYNDFQLESDLGGG
jgi:hypothetical protein